MNRARWELAALVIAGTAMVGFLVIPACGGDDGGSGDDGSGDDGGGGGNWSQDARCVSLCADATCTDTASRQKCVDQCSIGLHATNAICSACLLDNSCASGCNARFSALDCADDCGSDTEVVNAGADDPRCDPSCADEDACDTAAKVDLCEDACDASIADTSGPCASCLLDNVCSSGCNFQLSNAGECASLCN